MLFQYSYWKRNGFSSPLCGPLLDHHISTRLNYAGEECAVLLIDRGRFPPLIRISHSHWTVYIWDILLIQKLQLLREYSCCLHPSQVMSYNTVSPIRRWENSSNPRKYGGRYSAYNDMNVEASSKRPTNNLNTIELPSLRGAGPQVDYIDHCLFTLFIYSRLLGGIR